MDRQIVRLLGMRAHYVNAAAKFKTDASSVRALDRKAAMMADRREWAVSENLDPDFIESVYQAIVEHFTSKERVQLNRCNDVNI